MGYGNFFRCYTVYYVFCLISGIIIRVGAVRIKYEAINFTLSSKKGEYEMTAGDLNKKFGWIWLLIGPLMGLYITSRIAGLGAAYSAATREVMIAGQNVTLYLGEPGVRVANRLLHVHSGLLAILNIVYGLSIDNANLSDKTRRLGSILAVVGTILVTLAFYFLLVSSLRPLALPSRVLGGISLLVAIVIIAVGHIKK